MLSQSLRWAPPPWASSFGSSLLSPTVPVCCPHGRCGYICRSHAGDYRPEPGLVPARMPDTCKGTMRVIELSVGVTVVSVFPLGILQALRRCLPVFSVTVKSHAASLPGICKPFLFSLEAFGGVLCYRLNTNILPWWVCDCSFLPRMCQAFHRALQSVNLCFSVLGKLLDDFYNVFPFLFSFLFFFFFCLKLFFIGHRNS